MGVGGCVFMGMDDFSNASKEWAEDSTTLPVDFGDESIVFLSYFLGLF